MDQVTLTELMEASTTRFRAQACCLPLSIRGGPLGLGPSQIICSVLEWQAPPLAVW